MFYELYDWNFSLDEKEYHLINLNEVIQINHVITPEEHSNQETDKVYKIYKIEVYYTGESNEWAFYYRSESERHLAYEELKKALRELKLLSPEKVSTADASVILTNSIPDKFHPLEGLLRNSEPLDIPEVKLCE